MVRGKTQLRRIENATSRQVTFSKRRNGLLKKAFELSVLCDAEVGVVVFSSSGKLYEFASLSMKHTIERYQRYTKDTQGNNKAAENSELLKDEAVTMTKKIDDLESTKRKLLGENLDSCSTDELQEMESQLEKSLSIVRAKKTELYKEKIQQLIEKQRVLSAENAMLYVKSGFKLEEQPPLQSVAPNQDEEENAIQISEVENAIRPPSSQDSENMEVETELCIGWPDRQRMMNHQSGL